MTLKRISVAACGSTSSVAPLDAHLDATSGNKAPSEATESPGVHKLAEDLKGMQVFIFNTYGNLIYELRDRM
jgi:hypothetical protein